MTERRHATDREAGGLVDGVGIDAGAVRATSGVRELLLVELVRAADVGQHDLAVDREDQALHDLADLHTDRRCCVGRGLGAFRKPSRRDLQSEFRRCRCHTGDVGMSVGHSDLILVMHRRTSRSSGKGSHQRPSIVSPMSLQRRCDAATSRQSV